MPPCRLPAGAALGLASLAGACTPNAGRSQPSTAGAADGATGTAADGAGSTVGATDGAESAGILPGAQFISVVARLLFALRGAPLLFDAAPFFGAAPSLAPALSLAAAPPFHWETRVTSVHFIVRESFRPPCALLHSSLDNF